MAAPSVEKLQALKKNIDYAAAKVVDLEDALKIGESSLAKATAAINANAEGTPEHEKAKAAQAMWAKAVAHLKTQVASWNAELEEAKAAYARAVLELKKAIAKADEDHAKKKAAEKAARRAKAAAKDQPAAAVVDPVEDDEDPDPKPKKKAAKVPPDDPAASWADIDAKGTPDAYQPPKGHQPSTKVPPYERSLALWGKRKILSAADFAALSDELKGQAGRLAGIYHTSFTTAIYDSLGDAIREGKTLGDWLPHAQQLFDGFGAAGGERLYSGQTWSPWYADLVFRNATQASYASGRYAEMFSPEWIEAAPFWMYDATADGRTRPEHRALDGKVFRKDDVAARVFLPPWGHNCRCTAIELSEDDVKDGGYEISKGTDILEQFKPPKGWDADRVASLVPESQRKRKPRALPRPPEPPPEVTPAPAAPVVPGVIVDGWPVDPLALRKVKTLGGSTGAELVSDSAGNLYVRKLGANADHLREEFLADELYETLGVRVPPRRLYETPNGPVKLARFIEGESLGDVVAAGGARAKLAIEELQENLAADALMGNWDVVGMNLDNVLVDKAGRVWRIDNGGSLRFRAQGGLKGKDWNEFPTELWTLRDPKVQAQTAKMFGGADRAQMVTRIRELEALRASLLAKAPADIRTVLSARLDQLTSAADLIDEATADKWLIEYGDELAKHTVGIRKAGISARMPRQMNQRLGVEDVEPVDENGIPFDHLRTTHGQRSLVSDLAEYMARNGGDYKIVSKWASEQGGSSWSDDARAVKYMIAKNRAVPLTNYFWKPHDRTGVPGLPASEGEMLDLFRRKGEAKVRASFAAQHAFTRELLGIMKINRGSRKGLRLVRTENKADVVDRYGMKRGGRYVFMRGAMESYSAFKPVRVHGGEQFWYDDVPLLRILGTYLQERDPGVGYQGMFLGVGENEFVGMLDGLEGFYGLRPP